MVLHICIKVWDERSWHSLPVFRSWDSLFFLVDLCFLSKNMLSTLSHRDAPIDSKTMATPLELNAKLQTTDSEPLPDPTDHRELLSCFVHLTIMCPNITFYVHLFSQFIFTPHTAQYDIGLHTLCHNHSTLHMGLFNPYTSIPIRWAYQDVDWAADVVDWQPTTR